MSPSSLVCSSTGSTSRNGVRASSASMNASTSSTRRASTPMFTENDPSCSRRGCTAVMRTSGGSASSNWTNSAVHEKVRRSMIALASRASADTSASSRGSIWPRRRTASARRRAASVSARTASALRVRCVADSRTICTTLNSVKAATISAPRPSSARTARTL